MKNGVKQLCARLFRRPARRFRYDLSSPGRTLLVRMDIINRCNLRCFMCPYSAAAESGAPPQIMPPALFERIAAQVFPHAYHLALSCAYEPLMHPEFEGLLEIAARHEVPEWGIVTNGVLLSEKVSAALIRHRMVVLSVSLDGATRQTYRDIRGADLFDRVLSNVRTLQAMKRRAGSDLPHLFINFVLMKRNVGEIVPFLELCRELGAEDVTFVHVMPRSRDNPDSLLLAPELYAAAYEDARRAIVDSPMRVLLPAPFTPEELAADAGVPRERRLQQSRSSDLAGTGARVTSQRVEPAGENIYCASPWMMLFISPNGDVHPCSHRQNDPPFGNLSASPFEEIWNSPAYLDLRRRLYYHDLAGRCRTCEAQTPNSEPMVRRPIRLL
ncbi:MAG: radical SAM protein [Candidatus Sumerlaeia bacterium]|nr:radical SAM protein [Candidatus Sumerlaeia bacterium]